MKVCFTGDVFLGGDILNKPCTNLVDSEVFNNAHIRVINLEQPISDSSHVEDKCTLYTGSYALKQLKDLKIDAVNLAHNHIQDKGLDAIGETLKHLDSVKIEHFGAGANLKIAEQPYWLTDEIAVLGYCEFGKPHLRQIVLAENDKPGVNPLRLKKIKSDLDALPAGKKAILYFHWGMEHVWLPPSEDMILAKTLLEDDRVITIIGMHPHRVQGVISHSGKKAYMCLGNFIFPNFYIAPPVQIAYPIDGIKKNIKYQTRQYHEVYKLTYKKWRWVNRVSLLLEFCTESHDLKTTFVIQDDNTSKVSDFKGIGLYFYKTFFSFISIIYMLPQPLYYMLWKAHVFEVKFTWRLQIMCFHLKQIGLKEFSGKLLRYVRKKRSK